MISVIIIVLIIALAIAIISVVLWLVLHKTGSKPTTPTVYYPVPYKPVPGNVDVTVYYDPLCPYCQDFITNDLDDAVKEVGDIMNLTLIPDPRLDDSNRDKSGNVVNRKCPTDIGAGNCEAGLLADCAMSIYPKASDYVPFISCMEKVITQSDTVDDIDKKAEACAKSTSLNYNLIKTCATSPQGMLLLNDTYNKAAAEISKVDTKSNPLAFGYPYILINGDVLSANSRQNLVAMICMASNSKNRPKACS